MTLYDQIRARIIVLAGFIGVMWIVFGFDCITNACAPPSGFGIVPRETGALTGILTSPFVHENATHLLHNTIPLAVLGAVILINGVREFLLVVQISMLVAGFGIWIFGTPHTEHIGASGVVLGFFGYLLFRTFFDRRIFYAIITIGVAVYYGTSIIHSLIPQEHISWTAHAFGFLGGFAAARFRHQRAAPQIEGVEIPRLP